MSSNISTYLWLTPDDRIDVLCEELNFKDTLIIDTDNNLLLQIAGFLNLLSRGLIAVPDHAKKEATELLNKIGELIERPS